MAELNAPLIEGDSRLPSVCTLCSKPVEPGYLRGGIVFWEGPVKRLTTPLADRFAKSYWKGTRLKAVRCRACELVWADSSVPYSHDP